MSKGKLEKFAELNALPNVLQYPYSTLIAKNTPFPYQGKWNEQVFGNANPIVLELGCGRGEYTVGMGRNFADVNFVGVDIKGNRMWSGAQEAHQEGLANVRFLRTQIELLHHFFAPGELHEIWLTFPDPQMKKVRRRLTSATFLEQYAWLMGGEKLLHLKTDSNFLYQYTLEVAKANQIKVLTNHADIYKECAPTSVLREIQTYYEQQWLERGITIKYIELSLQQLPVPLTEPKVEIEWDSYRSYGRERRE